MMIKGQEDRGSGEKKYVPLILNEGLKLKERGWGVEARANFNFSFLQVRNACNFTCFENFKKDEVTNLQFKRRKFNKRGLQDKNNIG